MITMLTLDKCLCGGSADIFYKDGQTIIRCRECGRSVSLKDYSTPQDSKRDAVLKWNYGSSGRYETKDLK